MASSEAEAGRSLLSAEAVRERAHEMLDLALKGRIDGWRVELDRLPETARFVADVIREQYPSLAVPFHARWRHFSIDGVDLWGPIADGRRPRLVLPRCGNRQDPDPVRGARDRLASDVRDRRFFVDARRPLEG